MRPATALLGVGNPPSHFMGYGVNGERAALLMQSSRFESWCPSCGYGTCSSASDCGSEEEGASPSSHPMTYRLL